MCGYALTEKINYRPSWGYFGGLWGDGRTKVPREARLLLQWQGVWRKKRSQYRRMSVLALFRAGLGTWLPLAVARSELSGVYWSLMMRSSVRCVLYPRKNPASKPPLTPASTNNCPFRWPSRTRRAKYAPTASRKPMPCPWCRGAAPLAGAPRAARLASPGATGRRSNCARRAASPPSSSTVIPN